MGSIEETLADLRLQEEPNIIQTAKKHKVNRTTLSRRWNNVTGSTQSRRVTMDNDYLPPCSQMHSRNTSTTLQNEVFLLQMQWYAPLGPMVELQNELLL